MALLTPSRPPDGIMHSEKRGDHARFHYIWPLPASRSIWTKSRFGVAAQGTDPPTAGPRKMSRPRDAPASLSGLRGRAAAGGQGGLRRWATRPRGHWRNASGAACGGRSTVSVPDQLAIATRPRARSFRPVQGALGAACRRCDAQAATVEAIASGRSRARSDRYHDLREPPAAEPASATRASRRHWSREVADTSRAAWRSTASSCPPRAARGRFAG